MQSSVVPADHHREMKRKSLMAALLTEYKEALEQADPKQRKRLMKEIESKAAAALDCLSVEPGGERFLIR
jgi:hypothetical protein